MLECGIASPYVDWFHVDREALAGGRPLRAYPDESLRDAADGWGGADGFGTEVSFSLGYRRLVEPARPCPSSTPTTRRSAST